MERVACGGLDHIPLRVVQKEYIVKFFLIACLLEMKIVLCQ